MIKASFSFAGPGRTTYQAKIIKPDGNPLESSNVNFKFTILDPSGSCILYSESYSAVNMSSTGGLISFGLGSGVKSFPVSSTTFENVFSNITPFLACDSGGPANYTPNAADNRRIVMQFNDGNGWQTLPAMTINAVPYAMYANDSLKLNGMQASDFVQVSTVPTCTASEALRYTGAGFACVAVGSGGTSVTSSTVITALGFTPADGASVTTLTTNITNVSSTVFSVSSTVTSLAANVAASFSAITSSQWSTSGTSIFYSEGNVGIGTSNPNSRLQVVNDNGASYIGTTSYRSAVAGGGINIYHARGTSTTPTILSGSDQLGLINFFGYDGNTFQSGAQLVVANDSKYSVASGSMPSKFIFRTSTSGSVTPSVRMVIDSDGFVGIGNYSPAATLDVSGAIRIGFENNCGASYTGVIRYNGGGLEYCNGSSWNTLGVAGSGLTLLNGSASSTQSFANGTSGNSPAFVSANGIHTLNIPLASAAGSVTAGLISNADYVAFSNKVSSQWATSGTNINFTSGNVGIGTSIPTSLLQVEGVATSTANGTDNFQTLDYVYVRPGAPSSARFTGRRTVLDTTGGNGSTQGFLYGNHSLVLHNDNSVLGRGYGVRGEVIASQGTITQAWGVVGIANTQNNANMTDAVGVMGRAVHGSSGAIVLKGSESFAQVTTAGSKASAVYAHKAQIKTDSGGGGATDAYVQYLDMYSPSATVDNAYGLYIGTLVGTNKFGLYQSDSSAKNYFSGNVGIGTSSPSFAKLDVSGTAVANILHLGINRTSGGYNSISESTSGTKGRIYFGADNSDQASIYSEVNAGAVTGLVFEVKDDPTDYFSFVNQSGPIMRLYQNGNLALGMGTNTPTAKLHLTSGTSVAGAAPLKFTSGTLMTAAEAGAMEYDGYNFYLTDGAGARKAISLGSSVGSIDNASTINSTGNISLVPVGSVVVSSTTASTNSNTGALIVNGGLGVAGDIYSSGTIVTSNNVQGSNITATSGVITPVIQGTNNLALNPNGVGFVGIGTSAPIARLHLMGPSNTTFRIESTTSSTSQIGFVNTDRIWSTGVRSGGKFHITDETSGTFRMSFDNMGNVGIGTANPLSILDLNASYYTGTPATLADLNNKISLWNNSGIPYYGLGVSTLAMNITAGQSNSSIRFHTDGPNEKMRITAAGNVGIGINNPSVLLQVGNSAGSGGIPTVSGGAASVVPQIYSTQSASAAAIGAYVTDGTNNRRAGLFVDNINSAWGLSSTYTTGSSPFVIINGNSEQLRITQSGNVGIGTSNPTQRLQIGLLTATATATPESISLGGTYGTSALINPKLRLYDDGTNIYGIGITAATMNFVVGSGAGYTWYGTGTSLLRINNTGNLGVGPSMLNPTARIHIVSGTASAGTAPLKFSSGTLLTSPESGTMEYDGFNFYLTDGLGARRTIATGSSVGSIDNVSTINSTGNISLVPVGSVVVSSTTASTNSNTGALIVKGGLGVAGNIYSSGTIITSSNIQGTEVTATSATISPYIYGSTATDGNLTIDSTTHQNKGTISLAPLGGGIVVGSGTSVGHFDVVENGVNGVDTTNDIQLRAIWNNVNEGRTYGYRFNRLAGATPNLDGYNLNIDRIFRSSNAASYSTVMTIGASGNVGVGTSAPINRLHIMAETGSISTMRLERANNTTDRADIAFAPNGIGDTNKQWNLGLKNGSTSFRLSTYTGSVTTDVMTVDASGSVGIGATTPSEKLHLQDGTIRIEQTNASYPRPAVYYYPISNDAWRTFADSNGFRIHNETDALTYFNITQGGNVGIGTTSPNAKLHVEADDSVSTTTTTMLHLAHMVSGVTPTAGMGVKIQMSAERNDGVRALQAYIESIWTSVGAGSEDADLAFGTVLNSTTGGAERMRITSTGNVGIGTSAPSTTLQVAGPIATAFAAKSTSYTVTSSDSILTASAAGGAFTMTLPTAVGITGRQYTIKKTDSSANPIVVATTSSQTIDGATSQNLTAQYQYMVVVSDGSNWSVIGGNAASAASGRTSCPANFTLIGTSGSAEAYCISSTAETADNWLNAATACYGKSTKARLCSTSEWVMACVAGASGPNNMTGTGEWVADYTYGSSAGGPTVMGATACNTFQRDAATNANGYRCCFH